MGQELGYAQRDRLIYGRAVSSADFVHLDSDNYHESAFLNHNDYMLDNSHITVCYYEGNERNSVYLQSYC